MKNLVLYCIAVMALCGRSLYAEPLDDWLLAQVQKDEQFLSDAISQANGESLELLRDSRTYIPFFLEAPGNHASDLTEYKPLFDAWRNGNGQSFLPGGYIYRIRFADAPPLYATSAGNWDGTTWHSLALGKDFAVNPSRVWNGSGNDYLFATMLAGVPPKIVVYDQQGEVKKEEAFDANAADLDQRVAAAEQMYAEKGSPILEMLSLAEYLENPDDSWREVDLSGQFNLRNQQQRSTERERLKPFLHLTRKAAIEALRLKSSRQEPQRPHASSEPMPVPQAPEPIKSPQATQTPVEKSPSSAQWPLVAAVVIVAVLGFLWLWLKKRK
ncbi:MAG: hypothetical protein NZM04_08340 [Methylacidiphilales bacterium]|nr:hypothetical protein [Candidatus Methylacidiphilales bacterium]MDW8350245.1 hypothetical protein [Verrucomicrobiae bacterium]